MKRLSILMVIILVISSIGISFADTFSGDGDIDYEGPTKKEIKIDEQRMLEMATDYGGIGIESFQESYYENLGVPTYEQEESYYCAPATAKQTLEYINGTSLTQTQYATIMSTDSSGTIMSELVDLLNDKQSVRTYVVASVGSRAQLESKVENALRDDVPAILHIKGSTALGWSYNTSGGHYLNASGLDYFYWTYSNFNSETKVTDPWTPGLGDTWYTTQVVYDVTANRSGLIIY